MKAIWIGSRPQSTHDIRSFLGLASYYRKFIRGFSQLAKPLTDLTREKVGWQWEEKEEHNFLGLKAAMATAPVLRLPDFERQFVVTTDASDVAIGAILEQDFGSGLQPTAFLSRKLNPTEYAIQDMNGSSWELCGLLTSGNTISKAHTPL